MINRIVLSLLAAALAVGQAQASGVGGGGGGDRPIGARAMQLAMATNCEPGQYFYRLEEKVGANRPILERVRYVCVNGTFRRNGFVPKYRRCIEGEDRMITERETYGNHDRDVQVRYTCVGGMLKRNP
jgi:hypothetical protein